MQQHVEVLYMGPGNTLLSSVDSGAGVRTVQGRCGPLWHGEATGMGVRSRGIMWEVHVVGGVKRGKHGQGLYNGSVSAEAQEVPTQACHSSHCTVLSPTISWFPKLGQKAQNVKNWEAFHVKFDHVWHFMAHAACPHASLQARWTRPRGDHLGSTV